MYIQLIFWFLGSKPLFKRLLALKLVGKIRIMDFDQFFHSLHLSDQKYSRLLYFCLWPYLKKALDFKKFCITKHYTFWFFSSAQIGEYFLRIFWMFGLKNSVPKFWNEFILLRFLKQGPLLMSLPKGCPDDAQRLPWNYSF